MAEAKQLDIMPQRPTEVAPVAISDSNTLMDIIARAARDPAVDVDKMERLMGMAERIKAQEAKAAYYAALSEMQDGLPTIEERGEIKIGGNNSQGQKYALWEDINKAIKPVLKEHGFALSFRTGQQDGKITVTGVLSHKQGHAEETTIYLPSDTSGSKNAVQAVGSSTSYGKRYTAAALLNLTSGLSEDDDGMAGGGSATVNDDQIDTIFRLIKETKSDTAAFCDYFKIKAVPDLQASKYQDAIVALNTKAKKIGAPK